MSPFQCLLCDTRFDRPANHFCARECRPDASQHADFCRHCKGACLKAMEAQVAGMPVPERFHDRVKP
jgi:hypothetical protein